MPEKKTIERMKKDRREGKAPSTQAGEFVREEIDHIREGKHGAKNTKQAIAIGLSKARRAGVKLRAPKKGTTSKRTRKQAERDLEKGKTGASARRPNPKRSQGAKRALAKQPRRAASKKALSRQARGAAKRRRSSSSSRSRASSS